MALKVTQHGAEVGQTGPQGAQPQNFYTCAGRFPVIATIKDTDPIVCDVKRSSGRVTLQTQAPHCDEHANSREAAMSNAVLAASRCKYKACIAVSTKIKNITMRRGHIIIFGHVYNSDVPKINNMYLYE